MKRVTQLSSEYGIFFLHRHETYTHEKKKIYINIIAVNANNISIQNVNEKGNIWIKTI